MTYLKLVSLLFAISLLFASCEKDKNELPLEFKFTLLDTLGNEKTVFNQGENIIFSFQVINNSSEDLYMKHVLPKDGFFSVYRPNTNEGLLNYGRPYDHLFCRYIGGLHIPKNDTFKIVIPWYESVIYTDGYIGCPLESYHRNVPTLKFGNYYTEFSQHKIYLLFKFLYFLIFCLIFFPDGQNKTIQ